MNTQTDLSRVLAKINEIAEKSADGDYIYRGEPKTHDKVCSSLYRVRPNTEGIHFDINDFQKSILEQAKTYIGKTDNIDEADDIGILTELQHFGGKTNLIDFTENYLIALYFACDGSPDKDGRVILLKRESDDYAIRRPRRTINRVESQRSVFVESPTGFVEPDIEVPIPAKLKQPLLDHLRKSLGISVETIYNDLHGFIRRSADAEYLKGLASQRKAEEVKTRDEKHEHHEDAIEHYTESLKLNPDFTKVYNNRAVSYRSIEDLDAAIEDCSEAIELKDEFVEAYINRGLAYRDKEDLDAAIEDYTKAIDLDRKYAIAYNNRGDAYDEKGDLDAAIEDYTKAIKLEPEFVKAYNNRAVAYGKKGDFDSAIQNCDEAIKLKPDYASPYSNRGKAYAAKDDFDRAIIDYNKAIELNPEYAAAYNNRGLAYVKRGDFDAAMEDLSKAITLNPAYAEAYYNRGEAWLHLSEWENAQADLTTAREMGFEIAAFFHNDYESVADFEAKHGVKVPEDIAALLSLHFETVDTKPVVLTEGKTDARYIRTALELFGEEELLNSLEIRSVGKEGNKGDEGGGQTGLDDYHKFYKLHSRSFKHATLLLYDSDVTKIPEPVEKLSVKRIQENPENTKVTKGIENLFPEELFEERFYDETVIKKEDGGQVTKSELNKTKFCDWICKQKNINHFAKFDSIVQILKEFVDTLSQAYRDGEKTSEVETSPEEHWTAERFKALASESEYGDFYESQNQMEKLCEFGVDLMDLVQRKGWELTHKFNKYYFAFYLRGRRRVFGISLQGRPKLAIWLPEDILAGVNDDLFDGQSECESYHDSHGWGIYSEHVTVEDIASLLDFAYSWHANLLG